MPEPKVSDRALELCRRTTDAGFACGEWGPGDNPPYPAVYRSKEIAEAAILRYVARLESLATVAEAVHHQLTAGEASEGDLRDIKACAGMLGRELRRKR